MRPAWRRRKDQLSERHAHRSHTHAPGSDRSLCARFSSEISAAGFDAIGLSDEGSPAMDKLPPLLGTHRFLSLEEVTSQLFPNDASDGTQVNGQVG
jgi:hypothetical protein